MQPRSWCRHSSGRGFKGPFQWIVALFCIFGGDFQAGTSPNPVPQGWKGETAIGLRAEKAVLSAVGFYTNKKKYQRQVGLCAASSAALVGRVQAPCSGGGSGLCWCDWSGSCRPPLPGGLAPALSILTGAGL